MYRRGTLPTTSLEKSSNVEEYIRDQDFDNNAQVTIYWVDFSDELIASGIREHLNRMGKQSRTLVEKARRLLADSGSSNVFRAEAISIAAYLYNITSSLVLEDFMKC